MKQTRSRKKPYLKPEVKQVALRPEEAVLGFCKTSGGGALSGGTCHATLCQSQGS